MASPYSTTALLELHFHKSFLFSQSQRDTSEEGGLSNINAYWTGGLLSPRSKLNNPELKSHDFTGNISWQVAFPVASTRYINA